MKDNKINLSRSYYRPSHSTQIQRHESHQLHRYKVLPKKPVIFSLEMQQRNKSYQITSQPIRQAYGIFSMEKIQLDKVKEQKQLLDKAKMPSFNIKKMLDKNSKRKREAAERDKRGNLSPMDIAARQFRENKYDLKQFWNKYLQSQQLVPVNGNEFEFMNKNLGLIINRSRNNRSQGMSSNDHKINLELNPESMRNSKIDKIYDSKDRTTFFVNNFITTRYRKRHHPPSTSNSPRHRPKQVQVSPHRQKRQEIFEKNWVVPWQKIHDTQEDNFIS